MNLQKQPNRWSCLPTSFAMCLELKVGQIFRALGHDGSEVMWPELIEPYSRRSFHIQEMILVAASINISCTPFEMYPSIKPVGAILSYRLGTNNIARINSIMASSTGVCLGTTSTGMPHAVAWNGKMIYDPNGTTYEREKFMLDTFWMLKSFR